MDISQIVNKQLGLEATDLRDAGPFASRLHDITGNEAVTLPLISTVFWQAVLGQERFADDLQQIGASPLALTQGESLVVQHGEGLPRYDLVVLDPGFQGEPRSLYPEYTMDQLREGWARFRRRWLSEPDDFLRSEILIGRYGLGAEIAVEAGSFQKYGVVVVRPPEVLFTSTPTPSWKVVLLPAGSPPSSAGVVAMDKKGRSGVTGARHALGPKGASVAVEGVTGMVVTADTITDSCFIEVDTTSLGSVRATKGPLSGITPRAYESVTFEGWASKMTSTVVTGWSPELPFVKKESQLKVLTKPDTAPGDSGCALLDTEDNVLGFAFYRTGFGSTVEFAAWIWAESVFLALNLS